MNKFIKTILASLLIFTMVGCGESKTAEATPKADAPKEVVEISFWYSWTNKIQENNENLTKMFNETVGKEKGIVVKAEYQGTYDELHQKLQSAYVAGKTPAVTVMEIASIKTFAKNGIIEDLTPYIEKSKFDINDFYKGLLINCKVDEKWYGIPYLRSTPVLYMNTTLLEKAGLDTSGPKSWDELAEYAKTIKEKTGAYGFEIPSHAWFYEAMMLEKGTSSLSADEKTSNINSKESQEIIKFIKDLQDKGYVKTVIAADGKKVQADYAAQNCAMWLSSTADLSFILGVAKENNFNVNTAYIPKFTTYGAPTGGANLIMSTKISDKEKAAAWEFINWMTSAEQAAYASAYTGYVPTRKAAADTDVIKNLHKETPQFRVALDQLNEYGVGRPMNPGYAQGQKEILNALDAIWGNNMDMATVLKEAETKSNEALGK